MNFFIFTTFVSLFTMDYLANNLQVIPQKMFLIPEAFSGIAMILVILLGISNKRFNMSMKYVIFLLWFLLAITAGLIINKVDPLVTVSGLRIYLKSLPFFLLPMVYDFSEKQIRWQLLFLAVLCLTQIPITIYQRFIQYAGVMTGDVVGGSLGVNTSGVLSFPAYSCDCHCGCYAGEEKTESLDCDSTDSCAIYPDHPQRNQSRTVALSVRHYFTVVFCTRHPEPGRKNCLNDSYRHNLHGRLCHYV